MNTYSNELSDAEIERLAILIEEAAEVQQIACKILRHGYNAYHPQDASGRTNRDYLTLELGDLHAATALLVQEDDIDSTQLLAAVDNKVAVANKYLHHNTFVGVAK